MTDTKLRDWCKGVLAGDDGFRFATGRDADVRLARDVATRLLEMLPAAGDGGEHLSNGWLKSVGSDDDSPACVNGHYFSLPDGSQLFLWGYEGERVYSVTLVAHPELDREADDVSGEIEIGDLHTRGEFRRLADALGITLKEPK